MRRKTIRFAAHLAALANALVLGMAVLTSTSALAQGADAVQPDFARTVYLHSATDVHHEQPQALLRAVGLCAPAEA